MTKRLGLRSAALAALVATLGLTSWATGCRGSADGAEDTAGPPASEASEPPVATAAVPASEGADASGGSATAPGRPSRDPGDVRVVLYLIDTLRADRLGLYGHRHPTSPRIDALAAESVVFDQASAPAPWTLPSVASILTSSHVCEHGVTDERRALSRAFPTLAERMASVGFYPAAFYRNVYVAMSGLDRGYETFLELPDDRADVVGRFLGDLEGQPFFLYNHTLEPHGPWNVPARHTAPFGQVAEETRAAYKEAMIGYRRLGLLNWRERKPQGTLDNTEEQLEHLQGLMALGPSAHVLYDAGVREADANLGRVVDTLKRAGIWDDTLFILISDHGEEMGDHGGWLHDQSVYEELMRVPFLVKLPGGEHGGRRIDHPVSVLDVAPTILDYLGRLDACDGCRGESLMPLIRGEREADPSSITVPGVRINRKKYFRPWKESRGDLNVVLRQGSWKGIWNLEPGTLELYDLAADPAERSETASSQRMRVGAMMEVARPWWTACLEAGAARAPSDAGELDARTLEKLRAIGYVQ